MPHSKKTYESLPGNNANVVTIGKEQSFDYFFRKYFTALCFFAQSIIHHQEDAKDIVQECFVKLWDDADNTTKTETVKSFLYTMVRNRSIDYLRKQKLKTKAANYLENRGEEEDFFDELAFAEMMRQVIEHIEELPANMRTILNEYYVKGSKYKNIAAGLKTTPDAVRMQRARAIKLLQQKLTLLVLVTLLSCLLI